MWRAVSLLSAETEEEGDEEVCKIQEGQEQNCKPLTSAKNEGKTAGINTITHVFWDDRMRYTNLNTYQIKTWRRPFEIVFHNVVHQPIR